MTMSGLNFHPSFSKDGPVPSLGVLAAADPADPRLPLHPASFHDLEPDVRSSLWVQEGAGHPYGVSDPGLRDEGLQVAPRADVAANCDVLLSVDATPDLVSVIRSGQSLIGWVDPWSRAEVGQLASARGVTVVDADAMNYWAADGSFVGRVFHLNAELAGYAAVIHALIQRGLTGSIGQHLTALVIGLGHTAKGAIAALQGSGVLDLTLLTLSDGRTMRAFPGLVTQEMVRRDDDPSRALVTVDRGDICVAEFMGGFDIIVNCLSPDSNRPLHYANDEELGYLPSGRLIVDVAPVDSMAFPCAQRRPFEEPATLVANGVTYHAGNDSQRLFWDSATWAMNQTLTPYLALLMSDAGAWQGDLTFARAKVNHV